MEYRYSKCVDYAQFIHRYRTVLKIIKLQHHVIITITNNINALIIY